MRLLALALLCCPLSAFAGEDVPPNSVQWERLQQRRQSDGWDRPAYQRRGAPRLRAPELPVPADKTKPAPRR